MLLHNHDRARQRSRGLNQSLLNIDWSFLSSVPSSLTFERLSVGTYFDSTGALVTATDNIPRFDHDPVTHEPLGLLIESQRQNCVYPSVITPGVWAGYGSPSYTNITALDGTNTALDVTSTASLFGYSKTASVSPSTKYTMYAYIKAISGVGTGRMRLGSSSAVWGTGVNCAVYFRPSDKTFTVSSAAVEAYGYKELGDDWFMVWVTGTTTATASSATMYCYGETINAHWGLWNFQIEAGAKATSFIYTTTTAVTRAADFLYTTDLSWFNQTQGCFLVELSVEALPDNGGSYGYYVSFDAGSMTSYLLQGLTPTNALCGVVTGANFSAMSIGGVTLGTAFKSAFSYTSGNNAFAAKGLLDGDGALRTASLGGTLTRLNFGDVTSGGRRVIIHLRRFQYWKYTFSDDDLKRITT